MSFAVDKKFLELNETEVLEYLKVDKNGLSDKQAINRILKYGTNSLKNYSSKILYQKSNIIGFRLKTFYYLLLFGLSIAVSNYLLLTMLIFIFFIELIGLFKINHKIEDDIFKFLRLKLAKVRRNNKSIKLSPEDITVGDIIYFQKGDIVPADIRIIEINQDILIEDLLYSNFPNFVFKNLRKKPRSRYLDNFIFAGEKIIDGEGLGVVIQIGMLTRLGRILSLEQVIDKPISDFALIKGKISQIIMLTSIFIAILFLLIDLKFLNFENYNIANFLLSILLIGIPINMLLDFVSIKKRDELTPSEIKHSLAETDILISSYENLFIDTKSDKITKIHLSNIDYDATNIDMVNKNIKKLDLLLNCLHFTNQPDVLLSDNIQEKRIKLNNERNYSTVQNFLSALDIDIKSYFSKSTEIKYLNIENDVTTSLVQKNGKIYCFVKSPIEFLLSKSTSVIDNNKIRDLSLADLKYFSSFNKKTLSQNLGLAYKEFDLNVGKIKTSEILSDLVYIGQIEMESIIKEQNLEAITKAKKQNIKLVVFCSNDYESQILANLVDNLNIIEIIPGHRLIKENDYLAYMESTANLLLIVEENPEARFEIVKCISGLDYTVSFIGDNINDLPSLKIVNNGIISGHSNLAGLRSDYLIKLHEINLSYILDTIIESKKSVLNIIKVFNSIFLGTLSALFLTIIGIFALKILKIPPAVSPITILIFMTLGLILPNRSLLFDRHFSQEIKNLKYGLINWESIVKIFFVSAIISLIGFSSYLTYFIRAGVSPYYISTTNPVYLKAITTTLITLFLLIIANLIFEKASYYQNDLLERLLSNKETIYAIILSLTAVFVLTYINPLRLYVSSLNVVDFIYSLFFTGVFIAFKALLIYGRKNSKKELLKLYREIFS